MDLNAAVEEFENRMIDEALRRTGGNKQAAARLLGLKRTTLVAKLRRKLRQVLVVQGAQLLWSAHPVKQRRCMFGAHQIPGKQGNSL